MQSDPAEVPPIPLVGNIEMFDADVALCRRLRWLIAIRVLVAITSVGTYVVTVVGFTLTDWPFAARLMVAAVSVLTLLYIALLQALPARYARLQAYVQMIGDLALITIFIQNLGAFATGFSILYLITISTASVLMAPTPGLVMAGLAFLCHALPLIGRRIGLWSGLGYPVLGDGELAYNLVVHLGGFSAVALMAAYLARDAARSERALREKASDLNRLQMLYRDVVQSLSSGLITTDDEGMITSVNRAAEAILGQDRAALMAHSIIASGLLEERDWQQVARAARSAAAHRDNSGHRIRHERPVAAGGQTIPVGYSVTPLRDDRGRAHGFIVHFRDLTELRQLQERLRTQDRMATLGSMAAGLAHEVGNPLAAISGSAQMLASTLEDDPGRRRLLEIAVRESERLDRTVKTFLALARPPEYRPVRFDVADLIRQQMTLLGNSSEVTSVHRLEVHLPDGSADLVADPDQVSQVFWNVAGNALKAMPHGGTLGVEGRFEGEDFCLIFRDTGSGMSAKERTGLFEPFSSFFDGGVGIGMAIVDRIVEKHGGGIEVDSEPGEGSIITIRFPRVPRAWRKVEAGGGELS